MAGDTGHDLRAMSTTTVIEHNQQRGPPSGEAPYEARLAPPVVTHRG